VSAPERDFVTVVSGVPRSGTSLLMQMLAAGGIDPWTDRVRRPDADNPRGYFEYEAVKRLPEAADWVSRARGSAVKVIHLLVPRLPTSCAYRLVLVRRDWGEVLASQAAMLERAGGSAADLPSDRLIAVFERQLEDVTRWAARHEVALLELGHRDVLSAPAASAATLDTFLGGGLDRDEMSGAVDRTLHRQKV